MSKNNAFILIGIFILCAMLTYCVQQVRAEDAYECGSAYEMRNLPDPYEQTTRPYWALDAVWIDEVSVDRDDPRVSGWDTDTIAVTGAEGVTLWAQWRCEWRVRLPMVVR